MSVLTLIKNVLFISITCANCQKHEFCSDNTPGNCKKPQQFVLVIFIQFESVNFEKKQRFLLSYFYSLRLSKENTFKHIRSHTKRHSQQKNFLNV